MSGRSQANTILTWKHKTMKLNGVDLSKLLDPNKAQQLIKVAAKIVNEKESKNSLSNLVRKKKDHSLQITEEDLSLLSVEVCTRHRQGKEDTIVEIIFPTNYEHAERLFKEVANLICKFHVIHSSYI